MAGHYDYLVLGYQYLEVVVVVGGGGGGGGGSSVKPSLFLSLSLDMAREPRGTKSPPISRNTSENYPHPAERAKWFIS